MAETLEDVHARAVTQTCGYWHRFGRTRRAIGWFEYPLNGYAHTRVRVYVCDKHLRAAKREGHETHGG